MEFDDLDRIVRRDEDSDITSQATAVLSPFGVARSMTDLTSQIRSRRARCRAPDLGGFFVALEWIAMVLFAVVLGRIRTDSLEQLGWWLLGSQVLVLLRMGLGFARVAAYTAVAEDLRSESETRLIPGRAGVA